MGRLAGPAVAIRQAVLDHQAVTEKTNSVRLGITPGAAATCLFVIRRENRRRKRTNDESMRRHLQDMETDIERGSTP